MEFNRKERREHKENGVCALALQSFGIFLLFAFSALFAVNNNF
jgi:hypothetical protein